MSALNPLGMFGAVTTFMTIRKQIPTFAVLGALLTFSVSACSSAGEPSASGAGAATAASAPITIDNWLTHPAIVEVRRVTGAVDAIELTVATKELCVDTGSGEFERERSTDASGMIRKYVSKDGGEDAVAVTTYYYDAIGQLRFVFRAENHVGGHSNENRAYFDATGKRIWNVYRSATDPETNNPDIANAPYEVADQPLEISPDAVATPARLYDAPQQCN